MLTKEDFQAIFKQSFPSEDPSLYAQYMFDFLDSDRSGSIDFKKFMLALSVTSRGNIDERLEWAFRLYDADGDGKITYNDMLPVIEAIFKMVCHLFSTSE